MEVTPVCIEIRTQIALAIQQWFVASHVTVNEAARRMRLPASAACDVINLRIHSFTIDRLLRTWTHVGGRTQLSLEHARFAETGRGAGHLLSEQRARGRPRHEPE
jgi:predicted XRE-type DNA-binding protein